MPTIADDSTCSQHPAILAVAACVDCGIFLCKQCVLLRENGTSLCLTCARRREIYTTPSLPAGTRCTEHPSVPAVAVCGACKKNRVCETCTFVLAGGLKICPTCAASPPKTMGAARKKLLLAGYACAILATLGTYVLLLGGAALSLDEKEPVVATICGVVFLCPMVGLFIGISCIERRLHNPWHVWMPAVWNGLLLVAWLGLMILGSFLK